MARRSRPPSLSTQFTWVSVAAAAVLLAALAVFAFWAVARIDERSLARETHAARVGLEEFEETIPKIQDSSAIWDEAVINARARNAGWMSENLAEWMGDYYGLDEIYILDPADRAIHAAVEGASAAPELFAGRAPLVAPLVASLRESMAEAAAGLEESTEAITGLGVLDIVKLDGAAAVVSVRPILPSVGGVVQAPGTEYLHLIIQRLDAPVMKEIEQKFSLRNLSFNANSRPSEGMASWPVLNNDGRIIGFLEWNPERPAAELVANTAPAASLAILAAILALALLILRLRRTSSRLEISEAHAQYLAFHDSLTRVPNRALFEDRLERALASMRRTGTMLALHYIDLDRFKQVNDVLGHPAGDALIKETAERLSGIIREVDTIARLGGDEFAIIQVEVGDRQNAEELSARIIAELERPFDLSGDEAHVGASVGVVLASKPEATPSDMMRQADIALYEAKANGRGRFEVFAADLGDNIRERRQLERDLRVALQKGEGLHLVYQPIYDAASGALAGAEALVRWQHPTRGPLSPDDFIGLAEDRGLIEQLGVWVMRTACRFAATTSLPWVAVNVSPLQFRDEHLPARIFDILKETGLAARRLEIEITEGLLLQNSPVVQASLMHLRAAGVRVALDDFGTGYSSISYLRTYGVDKLKIDRSFVSQLGEGKDIDNIVKSIIDLARSMHMKVTAEGVETRRQQDILVAMGCNQLQGFLLSRPIAGEELSRTLTAQPQAMAAAG